MTTDQFKTIVEQKLAGLCVRDIRKMYAEARAKHMAGGAEKGVWETMIAVGDALEARIGEDEFYKFLDELDSAASPTHG